MSNELFATLAVLYIGVVITDTAGRRDSDHMNVTISKAFIRYVGNSLHLTDYIVINDWVNSMKYRLDKGMEELYFFIHLYGQATSTELTVVWLTK